MLCFCVKLEVNANYAHRCLYRYAASDLVNFTPNSRSRKTSARQLFSTVSNFQCALHFRPASRAQRLFFRASFSPTGTYNVDESAHRQGHKDKGTQTQTRRSHVILTSRTVQFADASHATWWIRAGRDAANAARGVLLLHVPLQRRPLSTREVAQRAHDGLLVRVRPVVHLRRTRTRQ